MIFRNDWFEILKKNDIDDTEYSYGYASLYGSPEMFLFEDNQMTAFMIFIYDNESKSFETPYGYGSFWSNTSDEIFLNEFFASFRFEISKRGCIAGLIRYNPFIHLPKTDIVHNEFVRDIVYVDLKDDFPGYYSKRTLDDIKRAKLHNLDFDFSTSKSDFELFGNLYRQIMKEKDASNDLLFKNDYFRKLSDINNTFVLTAKKDNSLVGGAVFILSRHSSYYHLSAIKNKKHFPGLSGLLLHLGIEYAHKSKSEKIILGGGMTSADDDSLLFFKKGFSHLKKQFFIGKMIVSEEEYKHLTAEHDKKNPHGGKIFLRYKYSK